MAVLTHWFPTNRSGTVTITSNFALVDNLGHYLVDNTTAHNELVTTPIVLAPQPPTAWTVL